MQLSFTTNFNEAAVRLQRIEQNLPVKQRELLDALIPTFVAIQQHALRDATPFNARGFGEYQNAALDNTRLADTTTTVVTRQGSNQFQSNALITTFQTKTVRNASGEEMELSNIIVEGRDTTGKTPITPRVKNALWSPNLEQSTGGAGPAFRSVKGSVAAPNDYFQVARENALPEIQVAAAQGVASMSESLFTLK